MCTSFLPAYKVEIIAVTEENAFVKYTATLLDVYKAGKDSLVLSFNRYLVLTMWQALY